MAASSLPDPFTASPSPQAPVASVKSIAISVSRLLLDYALQLRDDMGPLPSTSAPGVMKKEENILSSSAGDVKPMGALTDNAFATSTGTEDETVQLSEADVLECHQRLKRLQRIFRVLQRAGDSSAAQEDDPEGQSLASSSAQRERAQAEDRLQDYSETVRRNPVLTTVLHRFHALTQRFQSCPDTFGSSPPSEQPLPLVKEGAFSEPARHFRAISRTSDKCDIQPLLSPISLSEGALAAFSRNVGVVFRRRPTAVSATVSTTVAASAAVTTPHKSSSHSTAPPTASPSQLSGTGKRVRDGDEPVADTVNFWSKLAAQQRKARFNLYTLRSALLPQVSRVCAPLYVAPAVRELGQLNAAAEQQMLQRAWCVHTKAHVLREAPAIAREVEDWQQALRDALKSFPSTTRESMLHDVSYVQFLHTDNGILRLCVQHTLFLDLTYDLRQKQWRVLALHWNLFTTAAGATLTSDVLTEAKAVVGGSTALTTEGGAEPDASGSGSDLCKPKNELQQLQPENRKALLAHLQNAFEQGGLSGGVRAATRLVCAVVMDALALQLVRLQQSFFAGNALGRLVDVEVRPGTFISFHLSLSTVLNRSDSASTVIGDDVVHVKVTVCGGTVLMEIVRGTDLASRSVRLLLGKSYLGLAAESALRCPPRVVVDMEALLWQCVAAKS